MPECRKKALRLTSSGILLLPQNSTLKSIREQSYIHEHWKCGNNKAQNKTKADLELTIRLGSHGYWNFVLQAKSFRESSGKYEGWSASDNQILVKWANRRGQTPGMLLYNEEVSPFSPLAPSIFDLCKAASHYEPHWYNDAIKAQSNPAPPSILTGTPAGISMCLLNPHTSGLNNPKPQDFQQDHFPIEHLLHGSNCTNIVGSPDGSTGVKSGFGGQTEPNLFSLSKQIPLVGTSNLPVWAKAFVPTSEVQEGTEGGKSHLRQIGNLDAAQQRTIEADLVESGTQALLFLDLDI